MLRVNTEWLHDYSKRTGRAKHAIGQLKKKTNVLGEIEKELKKSPHAAALAALDANPDLIKGNQEHYEQVRIFHHFESNAPDIYRRLVATPNGGWRGKKAGGFMQAEGQKKGYPDMSLDVARGVYHGMRIELKYGKNSLSAEQRDYLRQLSDDGYYSVHCVGWMEAVEAITAYYLLASGDVAPVRDRDLKWMRE